MWPVLWQARCAANREGHEYFRTRSGAQMVSLVLPRRRLRVGRLLRLRLRHLLGSSLLACRGGGGVGVLRLLKQACTVSRLCDITITTINAVLGRADADGGGGGAAGSGAADFDRLGGIRGTFSRLVALPAHPVGIGRECRSSR